MGKLKDGMLQGLKFEPESKKWFTKTLELKKSPRFKASAEEARTKLTDGDGLRRLLSQSPLPSIRPRPLSQPLVNKPPIPPGLTISPQTDTACPAAREYFETGKARNFQLKCAIKSPHEESGFTARLIK